MDPIRDFRPASLARRLHGSRTGSRSRLSPPTTTRHPDEVQDTDAARFAAKLRDVFRECARVLKDDGLLVFTYHHSRPTGWQSLAEAILGAGFRVVNAHPVKSEMSVATPKSQAKDPIQLDIILVCRKQLQPSPLPPVDDALDSARAKLLRLHEAGFRLSRNDCRIVMLGQLLTTLAEVDDWESVAQSVDADVEMPVLREPVESREARQGLLF